MTFAKTNIRSYEQKQRLIDVFVNSVHVYDDKIIVLFNYKDGEKCISLDELGDKEKKPNTQNKCSTLIKSGDPSGTRTRDTLIKSFERRLRSCLISMIG